jgi:hypothetical protein
MIPLGDQASVTLRGSRQELLFGAQRLAGPSDFTNVRRTFDGGAGIVRVGDWTITPSPDGVSSCPAVPFQRVPCGPEALRHL